MYPFTIEYLVSPLIHFPILCLSAGSCLLASDIDSKNNSCLSSSTGIQITDFFPWGLLIG